MFLNFLNSCGFGIVDAGTKKLPIQQWGKPTEQGTDCSCYGFLAFACPSILPSCAPATAQPPFVTNTPRAPIATPTPDPYTRCQMKILSVAVANEVGNGGENLASIVANIAVNRLRDPRFDTPTVEELIRNGQISRGLLDGFTGSCPELGDIVYSFYTDPQTPLSDRGDIPENIAIAEQAVAAAWNRATDPTFGGFSFLVSADPDYISNVINPSATALEDMERYPNGCARWWMGFFTAATDVNPVANPLIAERVEGNNGIVLLYSNFVAPTTINPPFVGCNVYCSDPNDQSTCHF